MAGSSKPAGLLPALSQTMSQILEKRPLPSPLPEHVQAPPSTPMSQELEPKHEAQSETADEQRYINSPEPSPPLTPTSTTSSRRRFRKKLKRLKGFRPSLVLENSGSVARDHLASERTFLAYVRTSLLLATTGVALVQLFAVAATNAVASTSLRRIRQFAHPLGATLVVFGLVVLAVGVRRYFLIQVSLTKGVFPVTRMAITGITIVLAAIIIVVFGVLVSSRD
ncbi:hypothetical protein D9615_006741 [Tricholomella constricta]|uniref:DUF202 domain-containing protein n=1 Tax=Tricholomella constricta TaxID=117010 RepID=A0A8H5H705_9AGAR|nr:hypothetical protein D9615_006741 [Tricholomella constricta]